MFASVLPVLIVILVIVVLGATGNLFSPSPLVIAAQAAAIALTIWARLSFQRGAFRVSAAPGGRSVISSGPYRFVRHPMYSAALLFIWAGLLSHRSAFTLALGAAVTIMVITRVVIEERLLRARYHDYFDYARETKALVPYLFW